MADQQPPQGEKKGGLPRWTWVALGGAAAAMVLVVLAAKGGGGGGSSTTVAPDQPVSPDAGGSAGSGGSDLSTVLAPMPVTQQVYETPIREVVIVGTLGQPAPTLTGTRTAASQSPPAPNYSALPYPTTSQLPPGPPKPPITTTSGGSLSSGSPVNLRSGATQSDPATTGGVRIL